VNRLLAVMVLLASGLAHADESAQVHPYLDSKFYASVGLFLPDQAVKLSLDASVDPPDALLTPYYDFSESFGTSKSGQTFSAEIGWRFGERWQLRGQYFRIDDKGTALLEEDVEWGDYEFEIGSSVAAGVDMQITRIFFGRAFKSSEKSEFGLGLGGHILDISAFVAGDATVDGEEVGFVSERASISQPLPNIGAWYMHGFSDRLAMTLRLDWLAANIDRYDGRIVNAAASLGYAISDHFGIGIAYNHFEINFNVDDTDWSGGIRTRVAGPYVSLTGYW
jgi:hypothetical protein